MRSRPNRSEPLESRTTVFDAVVAGDAQPLAPARWDWSLVRRVLVVRLRSVGDTVLATPSLHALRRFLPDAEIDVLLEDWVAPLLEGSVEIDGIVTVKRRSNRSRFETARTLRARSYDVAYNLHGGSTAALLMRASGATHRVGYRDYAYSSLHNHLAPSSSELWASEKTHSAEQQLALLGWTGVPVTDRPSTRLPVNSEASRLITTRLTDAGMIDGEKFALMHPAAAFDSKTWAAENFATVVDHLASLGLRTVAIVGPDESGILDNVSRNAQTAPVAFSDLYLPEVTALASRASLFVGNDSGIAHIASAVGVPSVVVFGSSNVAHWRPWTTAPSEIVREEMSCAPCPGYTCAEFGIAQCIRRVPVDRVTAAIDRIVVQAASLQSLNSTSGGS